MKLYYFNLRARGEILRYLLTHSGIEWEDGLVSRDDWAGGTEESNRFKETIPAGRTGKKQLPVMEVTEKKEDGNGETTKKTTKTWMMPESLDISKWIAERCTPSLIPESEDMQAKAERVFRYSDVGDDTSRFGLLNPILNRDPVEDAKETAIRFEKEHLSRHLEYLQQEIGETNDNGPYVCGQQLTYVDFMVFHYLNNACTLYGRDTVVGGSSSILETYYDTMLNDVPAVQTWLKQRSQAGCQQVGTKSSLIYNHTENEIRTMLVTAALSPETIKYRRAPLLSKVVWFPVDVTCSLLYLLLNKTGALPAISALLVGGFFGLLCIPLTFTYAVLKGIDLSGIYAHNDGDVFPGFLYYIFIPFAVLYAIQILCLDKQHLSVQDAAPMPVEHVGNILQRSASKFWKAYLDYFPISVLPWCDDARLDPSRQYLFAVHPHGIHCLPLGQFSSYGSAFDMRFPGLVGYKLTGLAATIMFKLPLVRELFLSMGYVDASRKIASQVLDCGRSIYVCIGGEEESMLSKRGHDIVVLKKRKGFIRLALSYGVDIVPVYGIGNVDIFQTHDFLGSFRRWLQKTTSIALPIFHGRYGITPLPYKTPINVLIGKPIPTPKPTIKGTKPNEDLVNEYHEKYIQALQELHNSYYDKHTIEGDDRRVLEIL